MKNIKVTYKFTNYSRIIGNLNHPKPEDTTSMAVYEFLNLSDETADKIVIELGKLDFVTDYRVYNYEPVKEELSKARDS
jgi:hypothetical protein